MRLIDADVLKVKQQEDADLFIGDDTLSGKSRRDEALNAVANIVNAPTVDAVEVVRCKDCKHNYHNMIPGGEAEYGCTKCIELPITANFYCALGERKNDK